VRLAFVFTGLAIYVGMRWDDLGSLGRILVGFVLIGLGALAVTINNRFIAEKP
jgi:hypothetical protein